MLRILPFVRTIWIGRSTMFGSAVTARYEGEGEGVDVLDNTGVVVDTIAVVEVAVADGEEES